MQSVRTISRKGFTLVEILIVVIILGILAAIVIPQFTSASDDARKNSLTSQVQTLRSQIELYKLQHTSDGSELFDGDTAVEQWELFLKKTAPTGVVNANGSCGPYLQTLPVNGTTSVSGVLVINNAAVDDSTTTAMAGFSATTHGFVYNTANEKFFALDKNGVITK